MANCKKKMRQKLAFFDNLTKKSPEAIRGSRGKYTNVHTNDIISAARNFDILMITAAPFKSFIQRAKKTRDMEIFTILMCNIEIIL